jgi:hypothetical protein
MGAVSVVGMELVWRPRREASGFVRLAFKRVLKGLFRESNIDLLHQWLALAGRDSLSFALLALSPGPRRPAIEKRCAVCGGDDRFGKVPVGVDRHLK